MLDEARLDWGRDYDIFPDWRPEKGTPDAAETVRISLQKNGWARGASRRRHLVNTLCGSLTRAKMGVRSRRPATGDPRGKGILCVE